MMREEVLKELELWPVWTLRKPIAPQSTTLENLPKLVMEVEPEQDAPRPHIEEKVSENQMFMCFAPDNMSCIVLHESKAFSKAEETLWQNICKAMQFPTNLLTRQATLAELLENKTPKVLIVFGEALAQTLLLNATPISVLEENSHALNNIPCIVTFSLAHLLEHPLDKGVAWQRLCQALTLIR